MAILSHMLSSVAREVGTVISNGQKIHLFGVVKILIFFFFFLKKRGDFPGGPVVKNPPSNAGDVGSIPGWGTKIPHATGQLSPHVPQLQLARLNERALPQTTEPTCSGAPAPQLERENLHATTGEKPACCKEEPTHHNEKDPTRLSEDSECCN